MEVEYPMQSSVIREKSKKTIQKNMVLIIYQSQQI